MNIGRAAAAMMIGTTMSIAAPRMALAIDPPQSDYQWRGDRAGDWDPARHYQDDRRDERVMSNEDRVYRGSDGRYYCKRSDGTTGLIVGGLAGGVLGNAIGGTLGTLLGAGGGALLGRNIERNRQEVKCR
jgi:hypothetical protein